MSQHFLVTGGTGFIGRHSVAHLLKCGHRVTALTSAARQSETPNLTYVQCDLTDLEQLDACVRKIGADQLLHMAWHPVPAGLWGANENLDWVMISLALARSFIAAGGQKITMSGSCGEYDWSDGVCAEETTSLTPNTFYGKCKVSIFTLLQDYCEKTGTQLSWGRIFFVYGPYEAANRLGASVVLALLRGEVAQCSHGRQVRDYIHAQDAGEGLAELALSDLQGAYNLGTGKPAEVRDVIMALAEAVGRPELVQLGARAAAAHEPPRILAQMSKLHQSSLKWRPKFDLSSGAKDTVERFRAQLQNVRH